VKITEDEAVHLIEMTQTLLDHLKDVRFRMEQRRERLS
jgi:hypothetical protein